MGPGIPSTRFRWLALAGIGLIIGATLAWMVWGRSRPIKVLLVAPQPTTNMPHHQARAIALLLQDVLEARPELSVTLAADMPRDPAQLKPGENWLLVKFEPSRHPSMNGDLLGLRLSWMWSRHPNGKDGWQVRELAPEMPIRTLERGLNALPLRAEMKALKALIPHREAVFWDLVQAGTLRLQNRDLPEAERLVRKVVLAEPNCAEGWYLKGTLQYRALLDDPGASRQASLTEVEACFWQGLSKHPGLPRGYFLLAQLKTNSGNQRDALNSLLEGLKRHPRSPLLYTGLVYSARNAGLMELGRRAAERRDAWAFSDHQPQALDLLFLYLGDWSRFERTLKDQPGHLRNTPLRFYRGYLSLLRQQPQAAIEAFRSAEAVERGYPHYMQLARAYRLALEGDLEGARALIGSLEQARVGLRVPDGEFTLRMAEGLALAGDADGAMELCSRAFSQGCGTTLWFETSPLLNPVRGSLRWNALIQHLRERQLLLEGRFPPSLIP